MKKFTTKQYFLTDGTQIKTGLSLLGILRKSKKFLEHECIMCNKVIGKDADYIILNEPSPYYWHLNCLMDESPEFLTVFKTKTFKNGYFITKKLLVDHLQDIISKRKVESND
jgi:hypothetical protein